MMDHHRNVLMNALALWANKECDPKELGVGSYELSVAIDAVVDGLDLSEGLNCRLHQSADQTSSASISPATSALVAYLLHQLPRNRRKMLIESLPEYFLQHRELPLIPEEMHQVAESFLKRMRATTTTTKRGARHVELLAVPSSA